MSSTTHGNRCGGASATDERTVAVVALTPDEIVLFAKDARALIASAGDTLDHAYLDDLTLDDIEEAVERLTVGFGMLRAIERGGTFPVDPDTLEVLERNRAGTASETADSEQIIAAYDERGAAAYLERFAPHVLARMTVPDMLEDVASMREQVAKNRDELATYTGFLNDWEDRTR